EELIGKGRTQITMDAVPVPAAADYAAMDARAVLLLEKELVEEMHQKQAERIFQEIEIPLIPVLAAMEMEGIALDVGFLGSMSQGVSKRLIEIEDEVFQAVGEPFNLNSTQQLSVVLFERL